MKRISHFSIEICAVRYTRAGRRHVRFGSKADIEACSVNVRFTPESGHWDSAAKCPLCANSGHCRESVSLKTAIENQAIRLEGRFRTPVLPRASRGVGRLCVGL